MAKDAWHRLVGMMIRGEFIPDDFQRWKNLRRHYEGKRVELAVRRETVNRTLPQNALLHVLARLIAHETGETLDRVKRHATLEALGIEAGTEKQTILGREVLIVRHTSDLTKAECTTVVDRLKDQCAFLEIPLPAESSVEVM